MKKVLRLLVALFVATTFYACEDPVDTSAIEGGKTSVPPRLSRSLPANNVLIKVGTAVDVKGFWIDGPLSPLQSGSIQLLNASGAVVGETSKNLSGTADSIVWAGDVNGINALDAGNYRLVFTASDGQGTTRDTTAFRVFASLYNANHAAVYIAGNFNGWGGSTDDSGDAFELIADNTWERKDVVLDGGGWKLRNTLDWSDEDWGDGGCTGVMVSNQPGPNANTECWGAGTYDILFNDQTLAYTMTNKNPPAQRIDDLYLVGNFNDFTGSADYRFTLASDNTWTLETILRPGDVFRFSEAADLRQRIWGDNNGDGTADLFGASIRLASTAQEGYYLLTFIDNTFAYTVVFQRGLYPENLFLVGGSTVAGWDNGQAFRFEKIGDGRFRTYQYLTVDGSGFKFLPQRGSWDGDFGQAPGAAAGTLAQNGEDNITISADGFYRIDVDFTNGTFTVGASNWGIIGDATPTGWDSDTDMTLVSATKGNFTWTITLNLSANNLKFRENDSWGHNYGRGSAANSLRLDSPDNIPVAEAGNYTVTMTLNSETGYVYSLTKN